jgi:hypothetical protein
MGCTEIVHLLTHGGVRQFRAVRRSKTLQVRILPAGLWDYSKNGCSRLKFRERKITPSSAGGAVSGYAKPRLDECNRRGDDSGPLAREAWYGNLGGLLYGISVYSP